MTKPEIYEWLKGQLIESGVSAKAISSSARFVEDLSCDSLDLVESVTDAEKKFGVQIDDDELEQLTTMQSAVDLLADKINDGAI